MTRSFAVFAILVMFAVFGFGFAAGVMVAGSSRCHDTYSLTEMMQARGHLEYCR